MVVNTAPHEQNLYRAYNCIACDHYKFALGFFRVGVPLESRIAFANVNSKLREALEKVLVSW